MIENHYRGEHKEPIKLEQYTSYEYCSLLVNPFFRAVMYEELGLCEADMVMDNVEFPLQETALGDTLTMRHDLWSDDGRGNIRCTPVRLDRSVQQTSIKRSKNSKSDNYRIINYSIVRFANPDGDHKYDYPTGFDSQMPYLSPELIKKYERGEDMPTLVLTEGYKKAAKGSKHGLDIVGLPSITVFSDKSLEKQGLFPDIVKLIKTNNTKNIVVLWDGDCRNFSQSDFDNGREMTRRPYQFFNMVCKLREFLKDYPVQIYFAHVQSDSYPSLPKGLDDLLVVADKESDWKGKKRTATEVAMDLVSYDGKPRFFYRTEITSNNFKSKLLSYFGLTNAHDFYALHQNKIGEKPFMFGKRAYQHKNGKLSDITAVDVSIVRKTYQIPDEVDIEDFIEFGFYQHQGCYWAYEKGSHVKLSNFTMTVKHLIRGLNPKRIVEIKNVFGRVEQIELSVEELVSISKFKTRIEGVGNFSFEGGDRHLTKIKQKLYAVEQQCKEFVMLGHQAKENLMAWSNGVYRYDTNEFVAVDEYGMVTVENTYYLPYYSNLHQHADEEFGSMRKVAFQRGCEATMQKWAEKFYAVFGMNGMLGIAWFASSVFRDIIMPVSKGFPMLFAAGKKGSGKGTMLESMMYLWGEPREQIMLSGKSTAVAFMRKMSQIQNGIVWLDEYSDTLDETKVQSLKNIWDGIGYERGNKSNDNTTNVVPIRSSAIISGQDLPTADGGSLFSRVILLQFTKTAGYSEKEIAMYMDLVQYQEMGLTPIIHELVRHRQQVAASFPEIYSAVCDEFRKQATAASAVIEERTIKNYAIITAMVKILTDSCNIIFPFSEDVLRSTLTSAISQQQSLVRGSTEIQTFWECVAVLLANGEIVDGNQVQIEGCVLYVRILLIMPLYLEAGNRQRLRVLKKTTLVEFLKTSEDFLQQKEAHRFTCGAITSCMAFDREKIYQNYDVWIANPSETIEPTVSHESIPF